MRTGHAARKFWRSTLPGFLIAAQFALPAQAGQVAIATSPLFNAAISLVKPNLLFILDDSSSMDYNFLPDEVPWDVVKLENPHPQTDTHAVALTSSQCNGTAFNPDPAVKYDPPVDSNGNAFINVLTGASSNLALYPSVTLAAAPNNGYDITSPTTNLTGQFYYVYTGTQPALAYTYSNGVVDTTTTFYKECNSPNPPTTYAAKWSKKLVSNLSAADKLRYARWWSYYSKRLLMMKSIAGRSFQAPALGSFRVGLSTIHDKGADESATFLPIDDFVSGSGSQKDKFYTKLYTINTSVSSEPQNFTPSRGALSKAGRLFAGKFFTGGVYPGASTADKLRDPVQYSCQQNFTILASDGYWNSADDNGDGAATDFGPFALDNLTPVGNQDGAGTAPPMYEGNYPNGATAPNTLADVSMYYYQTDLRNPDSCTSGSTGANLCPVDGQGNYAPNVPTTLVDTNRKPHMTTLTVGLAINGLLGYSPTYQSDTTGDFHSISQGNLNWPNPSTTAAFPYATTTKQVIERVDDLWHAAVNGRGTYFNANDPTTLVTALTSALGGVASRLGYTAGATSSLAPIAGNNALFVASYITGQWTGNVQSQSINVTTGQVITTPTWCAEPITGVCEGQLETQVSPGSDARTIYFNNAGALDTFTYLKLSVTQQGYFNPNQLSQYATWSAGDKTVGTTSTLVDYMRGQSQYEMQDTNTNKLYRARIAKLGDIVDTAPIYLGAPFYQFADAGYGAFKTAKAGRAKIVFVSGNDGMLHAFNAVGGLERWAFVPTAVMANMWRLADAGYGANHRNYANGRLVWSDVCFGTSAQCADAGTADWHTILMGGLGGGGRSYYALDVTDPASPKFLWEFTAAADADHVDIGYSFGNPLAIKKSDGTWVVAVASGYDNGSKDSGGNSYAANLQGSGLGVLYLLNPKTGAVLAKYTTTAGTAAAPSGLARMSYWADNPEQNATALYAYGGDLAGNFWRFDINKASSDPTAVVKLATFQDGSGTPQPQPITTRPEMTKLGSDRLIYVATGKYLEQSDLTNTQTQSLYAIIDKGASTVSDRGTLAQRTLVDNPSAGTRTVTADSNDPANGWFIDFPDLGTGGGSERANVDMVLVVGTLVVPTNVPTDQICNASGYSWINFLDFRTGEAVGGNPTSSVATLFGNDLTTGINAIWIGGTPEIIRTGNATGPAMVQGITFASVGAGITGHRVGWREIFVK